VLCGSWCLAAASRPRMYSLSPAQPQPGGPAAARGAAAGFRRARILSPEGGNRQARYPSCTMEHESPRGRRTRLEWLAPPDGTTPFFLVILWTLLPSVAAFAPVLVWGTRNRDWRLIVTLVLIAIMGACVLVGRRATRRAFAQVAAADYRLCLHCRYPLTGLDDERACPECGRPFTAEALISGWRRTYPKLLNERGR
jgi:hypothetical protein